MSVFICRENRLENARIFAQAAGKSPGARLLLAVGADEKVAKSYHGEFAGTRLTLVRRTIGWYLEKAERGEVRGFQQRLVFTDSQLTIVQKKMMERAAELSRGL